MKKEKEKKESWICQRHPKTEGRGERHDNLWMFCDQMGKKKLRYLSKRGGRREGKKGIGKELLFHSYKYKKSESVLRKGERKKVDLSSQMM